MKKSAAPTSRSVAKIPPQPKGPQTMTLQDQTPVLPAGKTAPKKRWNMDCQNLYLTYPQCHTTKEEVLQNIIKKFGEVLKWCVIAEEEHKDGTPHLHMNICLKERYHSRNANDLDILVASSSHQEGKHGNYQATRTPRKTLKYITKEFQYLVHGDINLEAMLEGKDGKYLEVVQDLQKGLTPQEIMKMYPLQYFMKRKEIHQFATDLKISRGLKEKPKISKITTTTSLSLQKWLTENLVMIDLKKRKPRQKHLYLVGPTGIGKSYFLNQLREYYRVYDVPHEQWNDTYEDGIYDIIVMDEFNGQKTITQMNLLTDGYPTPLQRRGTAPYLKTDMLPVVLCSNKYPQDIFKGTKDKPPDRALVDAFCNRYEIIDFFDMLEFTEKIKVNFIPVAAEAIILDSDEETPSALATESAATRPQQKRKFSVDITDSD